LERPSLERTATLVGAYLWIELRSFELLGGWVQSSADLEVKLSFAEQSHHHAWHARLWAHRFPVVSHLVRDQYCVSPGRSWSVLFDQLSDPQTGTAERLIGAYHLLLPAKLGLYQQHLEAASPVADGSLIRSLRQVIADESADLHAGRALIETVLANLELSELSAAAEAKLEALVQL
jgi:hypothetical protein